MWKVIAEQQEKLPYRDQFKPFNFILSPLIDKLGDANHQDGFPKGTKRKDFMLIARFTNDSKRWYRIRYTNVHGGREFNLAPLKRKKDSEASPYTLEHVVRMHRDHPESKSLSVDGDPCTFVTRGLLQRASITAGGVPRFIGKETDRKWEQKEDPSFFEPMLVEYRPNETARITTDVNLQNKIRNSGLSDREIGKKAGVSPRTLSNARKGKRLLKSTIAQVKKALYKPL